MKKRQRALLAVAAMLLISATGYAENAPADNFTLDEVVVTATRTEKSAKDLPSAVQVITRQTIENQGAQTLEDVLRYATGIQLTRSSTSASREAVSIRGFDSRFSMILIDGKRLASEIDQNYELDRIPLENIERIEIVRGPVSSLYGTEALGGVINIITKKSQQQSVTFDIGSGLYSGGRDGKDRYSFAYDSGQIGKFSVRISGSKVENDALFKSNGLTYEPYGTRKNLNAEIDYRLSASETVSFSKGYTEEATYEYVKPAAAVLKARDYVERDEHALAYSKKEDDKEIFLRYYQSVMEKSLDQYNAATLANWVRAKRTVNVYEGRYTQTLNPQHRLTFGAEYRPETFRGTAVNTGEGYFTVVHPSGQIKTGSTAHLNYSAAYVQDEWNVNDKLLAIMSVRYDDSNKFESNLSPKLGLTYKLSDDTRLKMNVAQGFRSPTPNQLYQSASTQQGNPNLKSETSQSYDISIEKDWTKKTGKLTFFNNDVTDMIDLVTLSGTNKQYQNISKASIKGVEAEFTRELSDRLSWTNSYTYLEAVNDATGQRLQNRARHVLLSGLSYHDQQGFTASLQSQTFGKYLVSPGGNKSYSVWNVALSQKLSDHHKLRLGIDNIFNKTDEDVPLLGAYVHGSIQYSF
ncbi:TonB-dependent receptor plug domain-containing protein [Sporomusa aerivorans]|uniref:TonB-dependent receptor plug domain-containing protein n=1 Tax=Sporomusa aerivorans TaxID=204936 RepID=UPI00352B2A01